MYREQIRTSFNLGEYAVDWLRDDELPVQRLSVRKRAIAGQITEAAEKTNADLNSRGTDQWTQDLSPKQQQPRMRVFGAAPGTARCCPGAARGELQHEWIPAVCAGSGNWGRGDPACCAFCRRYALSWDEFAKDAALLTRCVLREDLVQNVLGDTDRAQQLTETVKNRGLILLAPADEAFPAQLTRTLGEDCHRS